jgi:Kazal-type serine protease inhibitor domain
LQERSALAQWQPVIRTTDCPFAYQPVCARSRKRALVTYANACAARSVLARIVSDGICPDNCTSIYKPVCARDTNGKRRTYMNACAAKNESAQIIRNVRCLLPSRLKFPRAVRCSGSER